MSRVTGPKLCLLVPIWIDLMTAWDFWMKLAKPDPMSDEMKKMRKCFKDAYDLFMVEQIWVWALGCWRVILFPLESRPCLPNLRVLRGHLARSEAMIYLPGVGDQLPFICPWALAWWLMQLRRQISSSLLLTGEYLAGTKGCAINLIETCHLPLLVDTCLLPVAN